MTGRESLRERLQQMAGAVSAFAWRITGRPVPRAFGILTYHRVVPAGTGAARPTQNVPPRRFREQLLGLRSLGHQFRSLSGVLQDVAAGDPIPPRTVVLTFDDGYANCRTQALPILRDLEIPATVFLASGFLESSRPFPFDPWGVENWQLAPSEAWRPLTKSDCHEMLQSGFVEFGAHTHSHQDFRGRVSDFGVDLGVNLAVLLREFGIAAAPFAFPFGCPRKGYASDDLLLAARAQGVSCALTTQSVSAGLSSDPFRWGRFTAYEWDTAASLAAKLAGYYQWAPRLRAWLAPDRLIRRVPAVGCGSGSGQVHKNDRSSVSA